MHATTHILLTESQMVNACNLEQQRVEPNFLSFSDNETQFT